MGTDIHLYVERRENNGWVSCDTWEPEKYLDDGEAPYNTVHFGKHFYSTRNYDTFAILADVRNGSGFAGVDTGDGFVPIAKPRGLPDDLSPELRSEVDRRLDHTPSWLTVQELMDYDWTRIAIKRGVVSVRQFCEWRSWRRSRGLGPTQWSGAIWGGDIHMVDDAEMERSVAGMEKVIRDTAELAKRHPSNEEVWDDVARRFQGQHCQISWNIPYYRAVSEFLSECLPRLWQLGKPQDVRIVFWFDS